MKTYTFLKGRQDNKWCSLKKFDFSNRTKKVRQREYIFLPMSYTVQLKVAVQCNCGAKKYGFDFTNIVTFWYLLVLKIVI